MRRKEEKKKHVSSKILQIQYRNKKISSILSHLDLKIEAFSLKNSIKGIISLIIQLNFEKYAVNLIILYLITCINMITITKLICRDRYHYIVFILFERNILICI